jgi:hypothetical protein
MHSHVAAGAARSACAAAGRGVHVLPVDCVYGLLVRRKAVFWTTQCLTNSYCMLHLKNTPGGGLGGIMPGGGMGGGGPGRIGGGGRPPPIGCCCSRGALNTTCIEYILASGSLQNTATGVKMQQQFKALSALVSDATTPKTCFKAS